MKSIGFIGYGAMTQLFNEELAIFGDNIAIKNHDPFKKNIPNESTLKEVCQCDIVIPSVPIWVFEGVIQQIKEYMVKENQILWEICSINMMPKQVMMENMPKNVQLIGSHPMFGPQTRKENGGTMKDLIWVMENITCNEKTFKTLQSFLKILGVQVENMPAKTHDQKAGPNHIYAQVTGLTLDELNLKPTNFDTKSFEVMYSYKEMVKADPKLIKAMIKHNPYAKEAYKKLKSSWKKVQTMLDQALIPE